MPLYDYGRAPKRKISKKTGEELVYYYHEMYERAIRITSVYKNVHPARRSWKSRLKKSFLKMKIPESLFELGKKMFADISLDNHSVDISEQKERFPKTTHKA
jgi:hypothetical protein